MKKAEVIHHHREMRMSTQAIRYRSIAKGVIFQIDSRYRSYWFYDSIKQLVLFLPSDHVIIYSTRMSHSSWFGEKGATAGLVAGFFGGLALGWLFSSSVLVNNSVKVMSKNFGFEKDQCEEENKFDPGSSDDEGEYKLVLVVRNDLKMAQGKVAAQCSHATLACFQKACERIPNAVDSWFFGGQAKVVCKCESDDDLEQLRHQAKFKGLTTCLIRDAGRTRRDAGSKTVLGIGPAPSQLINEITRHLKLY